MLFHPVTGCAVLGCRRPRSRRGAVRGCPRRGTASCGARAGPGLHRGCSVGRRPGRQGRSSAHRPGGATTLACRPPPEARPRPAPRWRTLVCLFRVGGACRAFPVGGAWRPRRRGGRGRRVSRAGHAGDAAGSARPLGCSGPRRALSRAARRRGRAGRGWLQPAGYDTGVKVYNSLTRRK